MALIKEALSEEARLIDAALLDYLPRVAEHAGELGAAMRHSLGGGKRLRGVMVRRSASTFGLDPDVVMPAACAFEMLHAATLVHDDLPAIDDSDLRRGRASCHVAFGEPTALLAGDALIIAAFEALARQGLNGNGERVLRVIAEFAEATGARGLVGGEQADILAERLEPDEKLVKYIHVNKTAKLIRAACRVGALLAGAPERGLQTISDYGMTLGLLFQITDDILDVVGDAAVIGKPTGADAEAGKQTYPAAMGLEATRREAERLAREAAQIAEQLPGEIKFWQSLAGLVVSREK